MNPLREFNHETIVAFDVDGTLIHQAGPLCDTPRYDVIALFNTFKALGCTMVIWSGGGIDYATRWAEKLGLKGGTMIRRKGEFQADIAFDDLPADDLDNEKIKDTLGKIVVKV